MAVLVSAYIVASFIIMVIVGMKMAFSVMLINMNMKVEPLRLIRQSTSRPKYKSIKPTAHSNSAARIQLASAIGGLIPNNT